MSAELTFIMGPTASGKSALALKLARETGGEIVSADSMQLYRDLPVGTAQPTAAERAEVPHHLVGIYELDRRAEVYGFCELAGAAIREIRRRGRPVIVCGGTGLYLKALLYGLDDLPADRELRRELDARYDSPEGETALRDRMNALDPGALTRWSHCRRRLIRALEVRLLTGKSILELQSGAKPPLYPEAVVWRLDPDAETLKLRIARRAETMLENGWIDEARRVIAAGLFDTPTAHQALGYRQIDAFLRGKIDRTELLKQICTATWQYARRQRTWFRHQHPEARVVEPAAGNSVCLQV